MCSKHKTKGGIPMKEKLLIPAVIAGYCYSFLCFPGIALRWIIWMEDSG